MKLQFKHQQFQAEAASAVCDVFAGQPNQSPDYRRDIGVAYPSAYQSTFGEDGVEKSHELDEVGYKNNPIAISESSVLDNIRKVQQNFCLEPSGKLEGKYNLTIEMETGVGKTYTYTKTMYELNVRYGFTKFIIVVPSVAIREGVFKSLQLTEDHFAEERARRRIAMTMEDWASRLDQFLAFDDREILTGPGNVSTDQAKKYAEDEFEKFRIIQDKVFESDFDRLLKESEHQKPENGDQKPEGGTS